MVRKENAKKSKGKDPSSWTTEHNLVEKKLTVSLVCPLASRSTGSSDRNICTEYYQCNQDQYAVSCALNEDLDLRRPTLLRTFIPPTPSSDKGTSLVATDTVHTEWKEFEKQKEDVQFSPVLTIPSTKSIAVVQERLDVILYQAVIRDFLPRMILTAAVEECQSQFLQQCVATQSQNGTSTISASAGRDSIDTSREPPYYKNPPSTYLVAPRNESSLNTVDNTYSTLPVQFTPSQLVQRIKCGCSLAWQDYERMIPLQILIKSNIVTQSTERRASSRIARQPFQMNEDDFDDEKLEWKVVPGGKVALLLRTDLIFNSDKTGDADKGEVLDNDSMESKSKFLENNESSEKAYETVQDTIAKQTDEENDVEINDVYCDNIYLEEKGAPILEWLGRKTAKFLTTSDIQVAFPSLISPRTTKKKKMEANRDEMSKLGTDLVEFLSPIDQRMWNKMLVNGSAIVSPGARLFLQIVNDEDTSKIAQWEPSSFGRTQFTIRICNEKAEREIAQKALEGYVSADLEYRERKAWDTWRHKGIHGGYATWPSWLKAVESWRKEHASPLVESKEQSLNSGNKEINGDDDLALAKSLAESDAILGVAGARRSRRSTTEGSTSGVFYGTQSNMTQKQLTEALLRFTSQSLYQTSQGLSSSVLDSSADPYRRVRIALGKLVWKRNQLHRKTVQTSWSDTPVWQDICQSPLLTVDNDLEASLQVRSTPEDINTLVEYVRYLHVTELRLRKMLMEHLSELPIAVIASAADEKPGGSESIDCADFDNDLNDIEWRNSGHDLLNKTIFRPLTMATYDENIACHWFKIIGYSAPISSNAEDADVPSDRPQIGLAKESTVVKRRCRFRVCLASKETESIGMEKVLVLTEGQIHAGLKAAELENSRKSQLSSYRENPFIGTETTQITLIPCDESLTEYIVGTIVGHDCSVNCDNEFHHRLLFLPNDASLADAVWVRLSFPTDGTVECRLDDTIVVYTLQRLEYQPSSAAYQDCRNVVNFLSRNPKAGAFLEPVDPIALNVPNYFDVVKNPMDVSTLSRNLENGKYSNIPPSEAIGRSPTARMLNGPFRHDVELIFDNAMLFNPPDDWIYQAAALLKKNVGKKIDQLVSAAEEAYSRCREGNSKYVDDDSDVDIYDYESDQEEYESSGRSRKRKQSAGRTPVKEDCTTQSIEKPTRLQKVLSESMGLRGTLANIPVLTDASNFSLPLGWGCRRSKKDFILPNNDATVCDPNIDELIALQKSLDARDTSTSRRSTRTVFDENTSSNRTVDSKVPHVEYYPSYSNFLHSFNENGQNRQLPRNRSELEHFQETMHEKYFAKNFHRLQKAFQSTASESYGSYADGSFPPYLGRVVPESTDHSPQSSIHNILSKWEIREAYLIPAIRWIIRGLIRSEHLSELESIDSSTNAGLILPNHVYYVDANAEPFDVVDVREQSRKKKRANDAAASSSDDEVELSAYEKMRAERVARNAERLKALGLS